MSNLNKSIRNNRFKIKDDENLSLVIETGTGVQLKLKILNASINGMSASCIDSELLTDSLSENMLIPVSKLIVGNEEYTLGRLIVKRSNKIEETNETLKTEFDLTLLDITEMQNSELLKRITELHESHTEKLAELIYEIVIKEELPELSKNYDKKELAQKAILIVDFLNDKSKTFSMKRMKIKNALQHCV